MPQKSFTGSRNSTSTYPFTLGRLRPPTTRQTTSRPFGFERMTVCPIGIWFVLRRTAPLSNTITVLPSSRIGWVWPFASFGKLRMVTPTSRQTGLERGDCPDLFSEFWDGAPGLPGLFNSGESFVVRVTASRSGTVPRTRICVHHPHVAIFVSEGDCCL